MKKLSADDWVPLATIGRPHGVQGEVRVYLFNPESTLLSEHGNHPLRIAMNEEAESINTAIEHIRTTQDALLIKFQHIDDRNQAETLRGAQLCVQRKHFPTIEADEFYVCDLLNYQVQLLDGTLIGHVIDFIQYPTLEVLVVANSHQRYEIPFTDLFIENVDSSNHCVFVHSIDDIEPVPLRHTKEKVKK